MQEINVYKMADLILSRQFDSELVSRTPFLEWDGKSPVEAAELEKLFYSYDFAAMPVRTVSVITKELIHRELKSYFNYKKQERVIGRVLLLCLMIFALLFYLYLSGKSSSLVFYGGVIVLYLASINYPAFIRRRLRKSGKLMLGERV